VARSRFIDFDRARAEADARPVVVRVFGREWELFTALPAKPVVWLVRLQAEDRDESDLTGTEVLRFMSELVPEEALSAWLDAGITMDELAELLRQVIAAYRDSGSDEEGDAGDGPGNPPRPADGPPSSSSTGPR
jgi:hypothetical protein